MSALSLSMPIASTRASHASSVSACIASPSAITASAASFAARYSACPASTYFSRSIISASSRAISRSVLSAAFIPDAWIASISASEASITSCLSAFASAITASPSAIASANIFCTDSTRPLTVPSSTRAFASFRKYSSSFLLTGSDCSSSVKWNVEGSDWLPLSSSATMRT